VEDLNGKDSINVDMSRPVNHAHPPPAKKALYPVASVKRRPDQWIEQDKRRPVIEAVRKGSVIGATADIAFFSFLHVYLFPEGQTST
jgi:hypothetical protein